ncbi:MAG: PASTA domain-containing protein [Chloroflexia bacterium]
MQSQTIQPVAQRYELLARAGSNGPVEVYGAVDSQLDRPVTVQILNAGGDAAARRFLRHQQIASSIHHCGVLAVYDAGTWQERPYSVMSRVAGETPREVYRPGAPPDVAMALRLVRETAEALQCCRDAGLSDWTFSPDAVRITGEGTAAIALIEGLRGPGSSRRPSTDASALGALLRLMLTGHAGPSDDPLPSAPVHGLLLDVLGNIERMSTANEVAAYLTSVEEAAEQPTSAYEPGVLPPAAPAPAPAADGATLELHNAPTMAVAPPPAPPQPHNAARPGAHDAPPLAATGPGAPGAPASLPVALAEAAGAGAVVRGTEPDGVEPIAAGAAVPYDTPYDAPAEVGGGALPSPPHPTPATGGGQRRLGVRPLVVALSVLAALALLAFMLPRISGGTALGGRPAGTPLPTGLVSVPDLRGKPVDDARNIAGEAGLNLALGDPEYSAGVPANSVAGQEPEALSTVQAGGLVTVMVSLGPVPPVAAPSPTEPGVAAPGAPAQQAPPQPSKNKKKQGGEKHGGDKGNGDGGD